MRVLQNSHVYVYVIRCDGGELGNCFYIGTWGGDHPKTRFLHHKSGHGSAFCRRYPPIDYTIYAKVLNENAPSVENEVTISYIRKYGFRRVRGGNMLNMKPNCYQISSLRWWLDAKLQLALEAGHLGVPDALV